MKKHFLLAGLASGLLCVPLSAQITFVNSNTSLHSETGTAGSNNGIRSGVSVCVVDVDNNGLDDIVRLDDNRYVRIEYQQSGGTFTYAYVGDFGTSTTPWGMSMADVDHNGYKDILFLGGSQAKLAKLNNTGTAFLGSVINLPNGNIFCQNGNFMDVNNDGWEDIFACNDVNMNRIWVNDGTGNFPAEAGNTAINFDVTPGTTGQNDESGNYSSVWTDFDNDGDVDLFVAHCRQAYGPGDLRRTDRLFVNNGNGTYTEDGASYNLNSNDQDWTAAFGDIDNDGDFDVFLTKHDVISRYYINDGTGHMTVSPNSISFGSMPMQSLFEDMDNDGFADLIITGDNDQRLYRNLGNGTFSDVTPSGWAVSGTNMYTFAAGDLNHDGKIDLYAGYGATYTTPSGSINDVYWRNTTSNSNHFVTLILQGTESNLNALGARAFIYGPWGIQTREVRASESYGTMNTFHLHFGLGSATTIDSIVVKWPAGNQNVLYNQNADQFITIIEDQCLLSNISINYTGSDTLCPGDQLVLNAPTDPSYTYLWSNGQTTPSITVNSAGNYSVIVYEGGPTCNATSPTVSVVMNPPTAVSISADGPTLFCPGSSVNLTSTSASSYSWNNSSTTQTINVTATGDYFVTVPGLCQSWNSDTITITHYNTPAPTPGPDVTLPMPASTTVTATGTNISWYDAPNGGNLLGTGPSYITPVVSTNTTYYAEDEFTFGGGSGSVGANTIGSAGFSTNSVNGFLVFDVIANCTLQTVEVSTDSAGTRIIELRNSSGTVLQSANVNIPAGTSTVTLNFNLTPGTNYQLGTNTAQNNAEFGFATPRLVRNTAGAVYPYSYVNYVNITGANSGTNPSSSAYYYFYNWQISVAPDAVCTSERSPVNVFVTSNVGVETEEDMNLTVYPNPADDKVNVQFTLSSESNVTLNVTDMLGRVVMNQNLGKVNGTLIHTIPTSQLGSGVYKVTLTAGTKAYHTLVVVK